MLNNKTKKELINELKYYQLEVTVMSNLIYKLFDINDIYYSFVYEIHLFIQFLVKIEKNIVIHLI